MCHKTLALWTLCFPVNLSVVLFSIWQSYVLALSNLRVYIAAYTFLVVVELLHRDLFFVSLLNLSINTFNTMPVVPHKLKLSLMLGYKLDVSYVEVTV
jgi:hypothetical protein